MAVSVPERAGAIVRKAALAADQVAVTSTPVDTGRARANWVVSFRVPSRAQPVKPNKEGKITNPEGRALAQGRSTIERWRPGSGTIWISNNVPYIVELDNGSSRQAPNGMSAAAIQAAGQVVRASRLLGR